MSTSLRSLWRRAERRYQQLIFREHVITRRCAGEDLRFYVGDLFGKGWYGQQHDPWPELDWIKQFGIQTGDLVIDCGANHGFTTALFALWAGPSGKVMAFEPLPHNMAILKKNLELNGLANVVAREVAIGSVNQMIRITDHPNASVVRVGSGGRVRTREVPVRRIDDEVAEDRVGFIKIDVEGFELEVLKGATRLLECSPALAIELHVSFYRDKREELAAIFDLVGLNRYQVFVQPVVDGEIVPYDANLHCLDSLVQCEVVHLFCSPRD